MMINPMSAAACLRLESLYTHNDCFYNRTRTIKFEGKKEISLVLFINNWSLNEKKFVNKTLEEKLFFKRLLLSHINVHRTSLMSLINCRCSF